MKDQYEIIDEYGYKEDYSYLHDLLDLAIKKLSAKGIFSVTFIADDTMHDLNLTYRGIDRTTDVLSFALTEAKENYTPEIEVLGEIFISIPKMKAQAEEYGHSEKRELSFLVIHGLLHLLGYDHMTESDEKNMFDLQREVLSDAGIEK